MDSVTEQECVQQERGKVIYETEERAAGAKWKFRKELRGVGGHKGEEGKGVQREI